MRLMVARLLVVLGVAACLWVGTPAGASADSFGSGLRVGATYDPAAGEHESNGHAGNAARVLGGVGVGLALLLVIRSYRRGARATRAAYPPVPPPGAPGAPPGPPDGPPTPGEGGHTG